MGIKDWVLNILLIGDSDTIKALEIASNKKLKLKLILNSFSRFQNGPTLARLNAVISLIDNLSIEEKFQQRLERLKQRARDLKPELEQAINEGKDLGRLNQKLLDIITN